jgi:glycosyltransferase involved in cell wall biosynthesis
MKKIIRTSTQAISLNYLLKGQLLFLNQNYQVIGVSGEDHHLKEVRDREKIKTISIQMQRKISPLKDLISLYQLYLLFKKEKPLLVHSITPKAGLLTMIAGYLAKIPIRIHTFTGLIFPSKTGLLKQILILMDKILCSFATNIYPEGQGVKSDLVKYKITSKPLKVLANGNVNGIDLEYYNPLLFTESDNLKLKSDLGITPLDFVFIFVGRLVGDKGINELIKAFNQISIEMVNVKLILVGTFETELDPLKTETLATLKANKNILALGIQSDVRPYYSISNVLVFPSYREGFPNAVIQAGAMGLPSIVTNINGSNEIIIEGKNGTIIPVNNVNQLVISMKKMVQENEYRISLQQNSRAMITSRFEKSLVWEAILSEYKRLESNV